MSEKNELLPGDGISPENNGSADKSERFESDTQKIVRKHLEDPDHQITDEEMQNIRVGMIPPQFDEATRARLEGEDAIEAVEEKIAGTPSEIEEEENTNKDKLNPWDIRESS